MRTKDTGQTVIPENPEVSCVLGIDPSLTSTGVVVLDRDGALVDASALLAADKPPLRGPHRLANLDAQFKAVVRPLIASDRTPLAVLEGYGYSANGQRLAELGEWVGLIKLELWASDIPVLIVPPMRLKKFVTGRGGAQKDEMRLAVYKRWGFEAQGRSGNDLVDAYALAQLGRAVLRWETHLTQAQREVVDALRQSVRDKVA